MALDLANYQQKAAESIMAFWGNREKARQKQIEAGIKDQGERAGVTGGKNLDGFVSLILVWSRPTVCPMRKFISDLPWSRSPAIFGLPRSGICWLSTMIGLSPRLN